LARDRELRLLPESTARLLGFDGAGGDNIDTLSTLDRKLSDHQLDRQMQWEQEWFDDQLQADVLELDDTHVQASPFYRSTRSSPRRPDLNRSPRRSAPTLAVVGETNTNRSNLSSAVSTPFDASSYTPLTTTSTTAVHASQPRRTSASLMPLTTFLASPLDTPRQQLTQYASASAPVSPERGGSTGVCDTSATAHGAQARADASPLYSPNAGWRESARIAVC
jgi:hypothetical protein